MQPAGEHAAIWPVRTCSGRPDWIDDFQFIEDGVAILHRKEVIEENEVDFPAHLPIDLQCFDSIFRQDEAVVFEIENLPGTLEDVLVVIDQENELALAFGIENESIVRGAGVSRDFAKRNLRGNVRASSGPWRTFSASRNRSSAGARIRVVMRSKMACEAREASSICSLRASRFSAPPLHRRAIST